MLPTTPQLNAACTPGAEAWTLVWLPEIPRREPSRSWKRDTLVWERAALHPDFSAGERVSGEQSCPRHPQVRGIACGLLPSLLGALLPGAPQALPVGVPRNPSPLSDDCIVLMVGPLRFSASMHSLVLDYPKILMILEVPSLSPLALGPSVFGFLILRFLILFLGLNYDYTASLRGVDLK